MEQLHDKVEAIKGNTPVTTPGNPRSGVSNGLTSPTRSPDGGLGSGGGNTNRRKVINRAGFRERESPPSPVRNRNSPTSPHSGEAAVNIDPKAT